MPLSYRYLKFESALRTAQIVGTGQASLEAAYGGDWAIALDGSEIPISSFKQNILAVGAEIAHIIGSDSQHPYRSMIYGRSANIANGGSSPTQDNNGVEFVGVFDAVRDADTLNVMTYQPPQTIEDEQNSFFNTVPLYNYNLSGNYIQFPPTTANVFFEGCVWDFDTQSSLFDSDGDSPLPQMIANTWIAGFIANSAQVGWTDAANVVPGYVNAYQRGIQILKMRGSEMPSLPLASMNKVAG